MADGESRDGTGKNAAFGLGGLALALVPLPIPGIQDSTAVRLGLLALGLVSIAIGAVLHLQARPRRRPQADWDVADVLDYLVNDSSLSLPPSRQPVFDPERRQWVGEEGVEHSAALDLLQEHIAAGTLRVWGRRSREAGAVPVVFDRHKEEIERDYWRDALLHDWFALFKTSWAQTTSRPSEAGVRRVPLYTGLMLNRAEVQRQFPPKATWRRIWRWLRRAPRVVAVHQVVPAREAITVNSQQRHPIFRRHA